MVSAVDHREGREFPTPTQRELGTGPGYIFWSQPGAGLGLGGPFPDPTRPGWHSTTVMIGWCRFYVWQSTSVENSLTTADRPKNWFWEHPVLGKSFVFWVIVYGIVDGAFKGILSVDELLSKQLPPGRESFTLQWMDCAKDSLSFTWCRQIRGSRAKLMMDI